MHIYFRIMEKPEVVKHVLWITSGGSFTQTFNLRLTLKATAPGFGEQ